MGFLFSCPSVCFILLHCSKYNLVGGIFTWIVHHVGDDKGWRYCFHFFLTFLFLLSFIFPPFLFSVVLTLTNTLLFHSTKPASTSHLPCKLILFAHTSLLWCHLYHVRTHIRTTHHTHTHPRYPPRTRTTRTTHTHPPPPPSTPHSPPRTCAKPLTQALAHHPANPRLLHTNKSDRHRRG